MRTQRISGLMMNDFNVPGNSQNNSPLGFYGNNYPNSGGYFPQRPASDNSGYLRDYKNIRYFSILASVGIFGFYLVQTVFVWLISFFGIGNTLYNDANIMYSVEILLSFACIGLPFLFVYNAEKKRTRDEILPLGMPKKKLDMLLLIGMGIGICIAGSFASTYLSLIVNQIFNIQFTQPEIGVPSGTDTLGLVLCFARTAFVPGIVEEFAMRGVVMQPLRRYGDKFAILMSALVFSLLHGNMIQIPFAFISGLGLGFVVIKTGSLWTGIIVHMFNNSLSVVQLIMREELSTQTFSVASQFMMYSLLIIGGICAVIYFFDFIFSKPRVNTQPVNAGYYFRRRQILFSTRKYPLRKCLKSYFTTLPMMGALAYMVFNTVIYIMENI